MAGKGIQATPSTAITDEQRLLARIAELEAQVKAKPTKGATDMTNIEAVLDGSMLTLRIDLSARHGKSSTGKTETVASTHGNRIFKTPAGDVYVGVNAYTK